MPATVVPADAKYPLLAAEQSELHAFLRVARLCPEDEYRGWLESGLRTARFYNGRTEAEVEQTFRASLAHQALLQQREAPEEARGRLVQIVDRAVARLNRPGGVR